MGHPESVTIEWDLAIEVLRLLEELAQSGLLSYWEEGSFTYEGEPVPEAERIGHRLREALHPSFRVGDKVVSAHDGNVGTVLHMTLFPYGWEAHVDFERGGVSTADADTLEKAY